jgi:phage shock protein PspC (stress-responsive transcriptional regulator)
MKQVITVSSNETTFQVDEEAYRSLRSYLDRAKEGLANDPDVNEVLDDLERSIADKCLAIVRAGKNVISLDEMNRILEEMGPVADSPEVLHEEPPLIAGRNKTTRRLMKQPDGAKVSGVCSGLAEYLGVDPVFVRIIVVALTFLLGAGVIGYLILDVLMPWPESYSGQRYIALKLSFGLAVLLYVLWLTSSFQPLAGTLGMQPQEIIVIAMVVSFYMIPIAIAIGIVTLIVMLSIKHFRTAAPGKE